MAIRRLESGRLVYYMEPATADFWDRRWQQQPLTQERFEQSRKYGSYPVLDTLYKRYIPKNEPIVEAGCGLGTTVAALQGMGFQIEGIDYAQNTIQRILEIDPSMPVRVCDVLDIDVEDEYYAAYLSYGVVEHRRAGPEPFLEEAYRVLRPGGYAFITVPYVNPLRKLKGWLGMFRKSPGTTPFYQYAFGRQEFEDYLKQQGFIILEWTTYDFPKTLSDEAKWMTNLYKIKGIGWRLKRWLENSQYFESHWGHMLMVVAQKPTNSHKV